MTKLVNTRATNAGTVSLEKGLLRVTLFAADAPQAMEIAKLHMAAGYLVSIGPMSQQYRGVRVTVWFHDMAPPTVNEYGIPCRNANHDPFSLDSMEGRDETN